jgi:DNA-binding Xre family transcriptional regulator
MYFYMVGGELKLLIVDGNKIKHIRETKEPRMTQMQLAILTGIQPSELSRIETGDKKNLVIETLGRIAKALDVKPGDLLKEV